MGSGKSHISKLLSKKLGWELIDLDRKIISKNKMPITEIFKNKGEIYFRKEEHSILKDILNREKNCIISVGGGTPAYFNNIELLNNQSETIFLRTSVKNLSERLLRQKEKRPLIANISDENLPEFVAKHLFERVHYYNQSKFTVSTDDKDPEEITQEIITLLHAHHLLRPR